MLLPGQRWVGDAVEFDRACRRRATSSRPSRRANPPVSASRVALAATDQIAPRPEALLARGIVGRVHLFGMVSFELFGQFNDIVEAGEDSFSYQMGCMADLIGLPNLDGSTRST
jgi:Tetracyclin repressor-like, C-terminal domain